MSESDNSTVDTSYSTAGSPRRCIAKFLNSAITTHNTTAALRDDAGRGRPNDLDNTEVAPFDMGTPKTTIKSLMDTSTFPVGSIKRTKRSSDDVAETQNEVGSVAPAGVAKRKSRHKPGDSFHCPSSPDQRNEEISTSDASLRQEPEHEPTATNDIPVKGPTSKSRLNRSSMHMSVVDEQELSSDESSVFDQTQAQKEIQKKNRRLVRVPMDVTDCEGQELSPDEDSVDEGGEADKTMTEDDGDAENENIEDLTPDNVSFPSTPQAEQIKTPIISAPTPTQDEAVAILSTAVVMTTQSIEKERLLPSANNSMRPSQLANYLSSGNNSPASIPRHLSSRRTSILQTDVSLPRLTITPESETRTTLEKSWRPALVENYRSNENTPIVESGVTSQPLSGRKTATPRRVSFAPTPTDDDDEPELDPSDQTPVTAVKTAFSRTLIGSSKGTPIRRSTGATPLAQFGNYSPVTPPNRLNASGKSPGHTPGRVSGLSSIRKRPGTRLNESESDAKNGHSHNNSDQNGEPSTSGRDETTSSGSKNDEEDEYSDGDDADNMSNWDEEHDDLDDSRASSSSGGTARFQSTMKNYLKELNANPFVIPDSPAITANRPITPSVKVVAKKGGVRGGARAVGAKLKSRRKIVTKALVEPGIKKYATVKFDSSAMDSVRNLAQKFLANMAADLESISHENDDDDINETTVIKLMEEQGVLNSEVSLRELMRRYTPVNLKQAYFN